MKRRAGILCATVVAMGTGQVSARTIHLDPVVTGFQAGFVVDVTPVPGSDDKVFLTDFVAGSVSILDRSDGTITPFLSGVTMDGVPVGDAFFESAAFSLEPSPDFETSGKFYVSINTTKTQNVVVEYTADPVALTVDPGTQRRIVTIEHPDFGAAEIHYGGAITFGARDALHDDGRHRRAVRRRLGQPGPG
jgi:hypothetical protein